MNYCIFDDMFYYCNRRNGTDINCIGCELCEVETETLASAYTKNDTILGTCCVTERSQKASEMLVSILRQIKQDSFIYVSGCDCKYKELTNDDFYNNFEKCLHTTIPQYVITKNKLHINENEKQYVKIQNGCSNKCSYCCVCKVRNDTYSVPQSVIFENIKNAIDDNKKEIELVGTQIMIYSDNGVDIVNLCRNICMKFPNITLSLNSINPEGLITESLLDLISETSNMSKKVYLSVQSGSDNVLLHMKRRYNINHVKKLYHKFKNKLTFCYDIICGYPTETKYDFRETLKFLDECPPQEIMVCRYSPRKLTDLYEMNQLDKNVVESRYQILKNYILQQVPLSNISLRVDKVIKINVYNVESFINLCKKLEIEEYNDWIISNDIVYEVLYDIKRDKDTFEMNVKLLTIRYGVKIQISSNTQLSGDFYEYMNDWRYL